MEQLSPIENMLLGSTASFFQAVILQPTIYWKNASQQGLPFTINPKIVYRGMAAGLANEMSQMGFQYATTGWCNSFFCFFPRDSQFKFFFPQKLQKPQNGLNKAYVQK